VSISQSDINTGFLKLNTLVKPFRDKVKEHFSDDPVKRKRAMTVINRMKASIADRMQEPRVLGQVSAAVADEKAPVAFDEAMEVFESDFEHYAPQTWPWEQ